MRPPRVHRPNNLRNYIAIHQTILSQHRISGFVGADNLQFTDLAGNEGDLVGHIACLGRILFTVEKTFQIVGDAGAATPQVQTVAYSYNANVQGKHNFLRYDNAHVHAGHHDPHHRHEWSWTTGLPVPGSPMWIGAKCAPHLGDVIEEAAAWYYDRIPLLGEDYADLSSVRTTIE